jgi:hypothetical protein
VGSRDRVQMGSFMAPRALDGNVCGNPSDALKAVHVDVESSAAKGCVITVSVESMRLGNRLVSRSMLPFAVLSSPSGQVEVKVDYSAETGCFAVSLNDKPAVVVPIDVGIALELLPRRSLVWLGLFVGPEPGLVASPVALTSWNLRCSGDASPRAGEVCEDEEERFTCGFCGNCVSNVVKVPPQPPAPSILAPSGSVGAGLTPLTRNLTHHGAPAVDNGPPPLIDVTGDGDSGVIHCPQVR